jgi:3-dehydroquinate synthase
MAFLLSKEIVEIATAHSKYLVTVGVDTLSLVNDNVKSKCKCVVITNISISAFYLNRLKLSLKIRDEILDLQLIDGEVHKTTDSLNLIYTFLLKNNCDRSTVLLALGGGVIGDLTGFAAATYMRGISYIQIPTTLLAMVDSSVGGKTGINHPLGKNMIGAFHQPIAVIADVSTLNTLPDRELRCGIAEIIKHACIADDQYFTWLEGNLEKLLSRDPEALIHAIKRSVEIKASIVQQDEKELGIRAILNFGHTFAHAIEAGLGFGVWLHGEAVGAGLVAAACLSERLGLIAHADVQRIRSLVARAGLPVSLPILPLKDNCNTQAEQYLKLMRLDKKSAQGNIRYVVLDAIGSAKLSLAPDELVGSVIEDN